MMHRNITLALVLTVLWLPLADALAWNGTGHMTVTLMAYRQLSKDQQNRIGEILRHHPHYALFLSADKPQGVDEQEWAVMRASTWPDFVRPDKERTKGDDIIKFHNGPWHYINVPYTPPAERERLGENTFRANDPNVLVALRESHSVLRSATATAEEKAVSLCWVLHLVGDVHQPLHCVAMVTREYPHGDRGGNDQAVRGEGDPVRLHAYWDDLIGGDPRYENVAELARSILAQPEHQVKQLPELGEHKTPADWVEEGFALAKTTVYLEGKLPRADFRAWESGQVTTEQVPPLPDNYLANSRRLARTRAALAGYRLAHELAEIAR